MNQSINLFLFHLFFLSFFSSDALLDGRSAVGWWARFPRPKTLPDWLCEGDLDYFVHQFENSGFVGGLYWYRFAG